MGVIVTLAVGVTVATPAPVMALGGGDCDAGSFLGFRPWYDGLCNSANEIEPPKEHDQQDLTAFVWTIVLNVLVDLSLAVAYLAIGFIIYGGYQYIMSQGDPGRAAKGKKTLTSAIIGTIIALVASVAVNTVRVILGINATDGWKQDLFTQDRLLGVFNWAYVVAGIVAVIFIIKGAVDYLLSQGDPGKVRKATQAIIYAVVGLVIVLLAAAITNFVIGSTSGAMQ